MKPKHRSWFALSAIVIAASSYAQNNASIDLVWQSRNQTFNALTKEFADLYGSLIELSKEAKAVPTTAIVVPMGKSVEDVLREQKLFDGKYFPRQLDVYVCKLNSDICTVHLGHSGDPAKDDAIAVWRNQPNDHIIVPEIAITPVLVHRTYAKKAGDTLKKIVVDERQGCPTFDDACLDYLRNLNRRLESPLDDGFSGSIVVPTKAFRATISIKVNEALSKGRAPTSLTIDANPPPTTQAELISGVEKTQRTESSPTKAGMTSSIPNLLNRTPGMIRQVVPPSKAVLHNAGSSTHPREGTRDLLFKLIRYPTGLLSKPIGPAARVPHIAVFDTWVDQGHCLLNNVKVLDSGSGDNPAAALSTAECGALAEATRARDHGTHVVGLIAAKEGSSMGPGINPRASIITVMINPDSFVRGEYLTQLSDRLNGLYPTAYAPDVVNLSFEYPLKSDEGRHDPFHEAIVGQKDNTLFVVSAGNSAQVLGSTGECSVRPACYGDLNVITVGALDLDAEAPGLLAGSPGSNYGDRVHIAVPGLNVVSTIAGNRVGVFTGTSQAAPVVAGVASLLYLYKPKLLPIEVKNRLIYTSDLFPHLYKKLIGGRLNVERALAYDTAIIETFDGKRVQASVRDVDSKVYFKDFRTGERVSLYFGQIKRLSFDKNLNYYTLFYSESLNRNSGNLVRKFVTLERENAVYRFGIAQSSANEMEQNLSIPIKEFKDYTSPVQM